MPTTKATTLRIKIGFLRKTFVENEQSTMSIEKSRAPIVEDVIKRMRSKAKDERKSWMPSSAVIGSASAGEVRMFVKEGVDWGDDTSSMSEGPFRQEADWRRQALV